MKDYRPCKMMPRILKELKGMTGDDDHPENGCEQNPAIATAYQIQSVPTMIVFMNGRR